MITDKLIHIHIPKTGGQHIRGLLNKKREVFEFLIEDSHLSLQESYSLLKEKYNLEIKIPSFAFTRNPWDYFVSRYFHKQRIIKNNESKEDIIIESFGDTVEGFKKHMYCLKDYIKYNKDFDVFSPFNNFILTSNGEVAITRTYNYLGISGWHKHLTYPEVTHIGRFENFQQDGYNILSKIDPDNFKTKQTYDFFSSSCKTNVSQHLDYHDYYNQELIDFVAKIDNEYIKKFNYDFKIK